MPGLALSEREASESQEIVEQDQIRSDQVDHQRDPEHSTITLYCTVCGFSWVAQLNCGDRTCPVCRRKFYGQHFKKLQKIIEAWGDNLRVMELTLKNYPDQDFDRSKVKHIRQCFTRLLHRRYFKAKIKGGFYFVHLTNKGNGWHLHLHIIYNGDYVPREALKKAWHDITKDSYVVWIRPCSSIKKALQYLLSDLLQRPKIRDCDKYVYNEVLKGSRLVQGFGQYARVSLHDHFYCPVCHNDQWFIPKFEPKNSGDAYCFDSS